MLVSICLPVFNGSRHLPEAVKSVLEQTHSDLELLIADDLSTDNSWELVESLARQDGRIKIWRNQERLGLFSNYNRTIGSARGEFIKPFAQDDIMSPTAVETMVKGLQSNETASMAACSRNVLDESVKAALAVTAADERSGSGSPSSIAAAAESRHFQAAAEITAERAEGHYAPLARGLNPGKLVILKCLAQYRNLVGEPVAVMYRAKFQDEKFSREYRSLGDLELWLRLLEYGDLFYIPDPLVSFRQHDESRTSELLEDLDWVLDFPRLSRNYSAELNRLGIDRTAYCSRFLELAAPLVERHCSEDINYINGLPPYKELVYYLLKRLPAALDGEANYKSVLNSTSWRVTKPLRMFKKKLER